MSFLSPFSSKSTSKTYEYDAQIDLSNIGNTNTSVALTDSFNSPMTATFAKNDTYTDSSRILNLEVSGGSQLSSPLPGFLSDKTGDNKQASTTKTLIPILLMMGGAFLILITFKKKRGK